MTVTATESQKGELTHTEENLSPATSYYKGNRINGNLILDFYRKVINVLFPSGRNHGNQERSPGFRESSGGEGLATSHI